MLEGDVPVGLGPLHTQYDGKGNAYTSLFVESAVAKWKLPPWTPEERADLNKVILDKIPVHYNIGHLVIGGSDTKEPYGQYLVAMNKLSKGRHLSVGPSQPESSELLDISGPEDGDALRVVHRAGAALRADPQGGSHHADRGVPEGREPRPERGVVRGPDWRHPQGQQGGDQDDGDPEPFRAGHRSRSGRATRSPSTSPTSSRART